MVGQDRIFLQSLQLHGTSTLAERIPAASTYLRLFKLENLHLRESRVGQRGLPETITRRASYV